MIKTKDDIVRKMITGCIEKSLDSQRALYDYLFDNITYCIRCFPMSKEEMEDIIQEIFIKIFLSIEHFDETKSNIKTWSSVIASRTCIDYLKIKKVKTISLDGLVEMESFNGNIDDFLATEQIVEEIENLPEKYREVFKLHTFSGSDHNSISDLLLITPSSSRVYLVRAREILQQRILKLGLISDNKLLKQ